ncbi:phage tail family protein [Peribacillus sp. SIMBA_075]|uniref:phage tail family protein n=1 Tax=Peribacillus sp. SIMBA_075 TaxID=3085813 RepID=UPI00397BF831
MELFIQTEQGEVIDTSSFFKLSVFEPSSPKRNLSLQDIEGRRGSLVTSNALTTRTVLVECLFIARDKSDFILKRDETFVLFDSDIPYYIIDSRQPFKRWKVSCDGFDAEYTRNRVGKITLNFTAIDGMSESTGSTLSPLSFDSETWGIGQNLLNDDNGYIFTNRNFKIYNAGDIEVDPREKPLIITFKGSSDGLTIRNNTTGEYWRYSGSTNSYDTITLDQVFSRKNDASIFNDTNRKSVKLLKGWNEFTISGTTSAFEIAFDFRFYYL